MGENKSQKKRPYTDNCISLRIKHLEAEKRGAAKALLLAEGDAFLRVRAHVVALERTLRWYRGRLSPRGPYPEQLAGEGRRRARKNRDRLVLDLAQNPRALKLPQETHPTGNGVRANAAYRWELEEDL